MKFLFEVNFVVKVYIKNLEFFLNLGVWEFKNNLLLIVMFILGGVKVYLRVEVDC